MSGIERATVVHSSEITDMGKVREQGVTVGNLLLGSREDRLGHQP